MRMLDPQEALLAERLDHWMDNFQLGVNYWAIRSVNYHGVWEVMRLVRPPRSNLPYAGLWIQRVGEPQEYIHVGATHGCFLGHTPPLTLSDEDRWDRPLQRQVG